MKVYLSKLEEKISTSMGRKISIASNKKKPGQGKLEIEYYNDGDLEDLLRQLCGNNIFVFSI